MPFALEALWQLFDQAADVLRYLFVLAFRRVLRQHIHVCEHVEAQSGGEVFVFDAVPGDVFCRGLLLADADEEARCEALEVFDLSHLPSIAFATFSQFIA